MKFGNVDWLVLYWDQCFIYQTISYISRPKAKVHKDRTSFLATKKMNILTESFLEMDNTKQNLLK